MNRIDKFANYTAMLAMDSKEYIKSYKMAAIVVRRNNIMAFGLTKLKSHPMAVKFQRSPKYPGQELTIGIHAEIDAIMNAMRTGVDLARCDLFVARVGKLNTWLLAKPCNGCQRLIVASNLRNVYYTTEKGVKKL